MSHHGQIGNGMLACFSLRFLIFFALFLMEQNFMLLLFQNITCLLVRYEY